jgi:putative hydroxymethylpyrimidine transport system substrate-binding protein
MRTRNILIGIGLAVCLNLSAFAERPLQVMLDFFPNPNHVPLIVALERGYFADEGLDVEIIVPENPSDPVKLVAAGAVYIGLTPQINLLIACDAGLPVIAIGSLINCPLGGLLGLKDAGVNDLSDLRGARIGYSLAPLEPILWKTMLESEGIEADDYDLINVGFNTVLALLSGQVDAIGAFRNFEVLQVAIAGKKPSFFPQEEYGVPHTEELLIVVNKHKIVPDCARVSAFLSALTRGIAYTRKYPTDAFSSFVKAYPDLDDELNRLAYQQTVPLYSGGARMGDAEEWQVLHDYLYDNGLIESRLVLSKVYTEEYLPEECLPAADSKEP